MPKPKQSTIEVHVAVYSRAKDLGKLLDQKGAVEILMLLADGPKRWREIEKATKLPNTTLRRDLKQLVRLQLVRKEHARLVRPTVLYRPTDFGIELIKFLGQFSRLPMTIEGVEA